MIESILSYLWQTSLLTLIQILILLGPGFLLTLFLNFETAFVQKRAINALGRGWFLGLFGWLGTIVHELGHAIFCLVFWHKITDMQLFHPDRNTGTLGYVKHSYNQRNVYQSAGNFFIGIGPILLGTGVIFLFTYWLLGLNPFNIVGNFSFASSQLNSWSALKELFQGLWSASGRLLADIFSRQHLSSWQLYVYIYLVFAIGSSITLSPSDIKAALSGFIIIVILIFILNLATVWAGNYLSNFVIEIAGIYALFYTAIFIISLVYIAVAIFVILPLSLLRPGRSKAT